MTHRPTTGLTADTRELLTLIRDALDLPPAATADDHEVRLRLRGDNAIRVAVQLDHLLAEADPDVGRTAQILQATLAAHRTAYTVRDSTDPAQASVPGQWPGGEPASVRDASADDEQDGDA